MAKVKDIDIELNTDLNGYASKITNIVNGELLSILFECDKTVKFQISLTDYPDIIVYNNISISGSRLIPLKFQTQTHDDEQFNFTQSSLFLNDKLTVEVLGMSNTKVKIKVRYR